MSALDRSDTELPTDRPGRGARELTMARDGRLTARPLPDAVLSTLAKLAGAVRAQMTLEISTLDHSVSSARSKAPIS